MYSDDIEYARRRLVNTVIRTPAGNPFYVVSIDQGPDDLLCFGQDLVVERDFTFPLRSLNLEPIPLGFVNLSSSMLFLCRKPMRRDWRQGLSLQSLVVYGGDARDISFKLLKQPVLKQYPSWRQAVERLTSTSKSSIAFSRDFGLTKRHGGLDLVYRKHLVGTVLNGVPRLSPDKFFLQQHLDEMMG